MAPDAAVIAPPPAALAAALWGWVPSGGLAFDIGAHTGESLPSLAARFARIVALEPGEAAFAALTAHRAAWAKVTFLRQAAATHEGTTALSVREFPATQKMLCDPDAPAGASERMMSTWWTAETGRREVPCTTLDALVAQYGTPAFVKIDTEGGEGKILRGALQLLAAGTTSWAVEFHSPALRAGCLDLLGGYAVTWVRNPPEVAAHGDDEAADETGWLLAAPRPGGER